MRLAARNHVRLTLTFVSFLPAFAQTPAACTAPSTFSTLNIERTWTLANVSSAAMPTVPDSLIAHLNANRILSLNDIVRVHN